MEQPQEVDATELVNELAMRIAQLTVENSALRIENRKLRESGKVA